MMLRALIVEDDPAWCELLSRSLSTISDIQVECVNDPDVAWERLLAHDYALVTTDISLVAVVTADAVVDRKGFDLLRRMRSSDYPPDPALLIVSGYPTMAHVRDAFAEYGVDDFIAKANFDGLAFATRAREAIFTALVRTAERRAQHRSQITISINDSHVILAELQSPARKATYVPVSTAFDAAAFARRGDELNVMALKRDGSWRPSARALGQDVYKALMSNPNVASALILGNDLSSRHHPAVLHFTGDGIVLGVPFELMTDGNDYLGFERVIARRLTSDGQPTKKGEAFHEFLRRLHRERGPLRILMVAADSEGSIPLVETEAMAVRAQLQRDLDLLGIPVAFDDIRGGDATHKAITEQLRSGRHHIFHYAGHGRFSDTLPEISGLVLSDGTCLRATELKQLVAESALRLAFLSCCVGARSAQDVGRGDFHGTIEALVRGGIPIAIGYRWVVSDDGALTFATNFYEELLNTLSPGLAVLRSRNAATNPAEGGRNNSTWASPIIVCQTVL